MSPKFENIKSCFLGLATGDALGVPVEFRDRSYFKDHPVKDMLGYGTWNQPPGTWSDDSSLAFCLAESLVSGYDLKDIGKKFVAWYLMSTGVPIINYSISVEPPGWRLQGSETVKIQDLRARLTKIQMVMDR